MNRDRETGKGWEPELEELKERKALAARMGGAEKVARHKGLGKLTVRERIDRLRRSGQLSTSSAAWRQGELRREGNLTGFTRRTW
jgi:acetyl-CoA carboxylase carboxyltransferase component